MDIRKYPLVSDQIDYEELAVIIRELEKILGQHVEGDIVELGCYEGTTSLFIQRLLREQGSDRRLHVYDSFAGLPDKARQDDSPAGLLFKAGELAASKQTLIRNFKVAGLPLPTIHKAWFSDLTSNDIPPAIAFAFLDGDFYESIRDSLRVITPHLASDATIVIDDYWSEALPGAKRAADEWLRTHPGYRCHPEKSLGIITPRTVI